MNGKIFTAGVDMGSRTSKAVVVDELNQIMGGALVDTGVIPSQSGQDALNKALMAAKITSSQLKAVVATGYGRVKASFADKAITEITCHAKGVHALNDDVRTIIDIGGQDSKIIKLDKNGNVEDFAMNDRCAAGTGKFLEIVSTALGSDLEEFAELYFESRNTCSISSMCTVFAESEVVSLLADGKEKADIIAGLHKAVAARVSNMALRLGLEEKVGFTGGVARNKGMVAALESELKVNFCKLNYDPQMMGALGAAIMAAKSVGE